eukprot:SAG31_NODE_781_length_12127_cov_34.178334_12_plen_69_part_00
MESRLLLQRHGCRCEVPLHNRVISTLLRWLGLIGQTTSRTTLDNAIAAVAAELEAMRAAQQDAGGVCF